MEIITQYDDPEIVAGYRLTPAQEKLADCLVMMTGSGIKSAKNKKVTYCKQTAMHRLGNHMKYASQDQRTNISQNWNLGLTLL
jgi:hypothetical protein